MSVGRYFDLRTPLVDFFEAAIALPSFAGGVDIGASRHFYELTTILDTPVSPPAIPTSAKCARLRIGRDGAAGMYRHSDSARHVQRHTEQQAGRQPIYHPWFQFDHVQPTHVTVKKFAPVCAGRRRMDI